MSSRVSIGVLPPLPVGHSIAPILRGFNEHRDLLRSDSRILVSDLAPLTAPRDFLTRSHRFVFGPDLSIRARSSTSTHLQTDTDLPMGRFELEIPFSGDFETRIDGSLLRGRGGVCAAGFPLPGRTTDASTLSALVVSVANERLERTAAAMFAQRQAPARALRLSVPRVLPMVVGALDFNAMFRRLCAWVDEGSQAPEVLRLTGVDDLFCRAAVLMLLAQEWPELQPDAGVSTQHSDLKRVVDYIMANLSRPIRLSDLEALSGMGARALRYAFHKRFGCSPMAWVRLQRLDLARARLLKPRPGVGVTEVALESGFSRLGDFSLAYRRRFGESPSATLAAGRRSN